MSYGGDNYGLAEDVAVYSFDSLGDDHDLGGLLDEGMNDFNDETFGGDGGAAAALQDDFAPVGRDFDFAGNTARMLGNDTPVQPLDQSWMSSSAKTSPAPGASSAWNSLDADPLLSNTSSYRSTPPVRTHVPPSAPPGRAMRTLDEIEAEMRTQALARSSPAPASASASLASGGGARPLTLEEVEAEMLRQARQGAVPQQAPPPPQQPSQQPGYPPLGPGGGPQQPFFGGAMPPPAFPPQLVGAQPFPFGPGSPFPPPPFGRGMPPHPPFPVGSGGIPISPPPHLLPGAPGPSPTVQAQQLLRHPGATPVAAHVPMPGGLMNTLFPPLPSQAGRDGAAGGAVPSVEQQLQFLTMNQHAQHPSLTGAQLQALLQQAHKSVEAGVGPGPGGAEGQTGGQDDDDETKKKAGEDLIRTVEQRIMEHERMEQKRKRKAMKIASMAKHNNLMSNSDKDFITRIQVSQLVTDDPYADDFYFHIMAAIKLSRHQAALAAGAPPGAIPPSMMAGGGGPAMGPGGPRLGTPQQGGGANNNNNRRPTRRENAMNRMAQNVQRLVDSAKQRNKSGQLSLDGALGKIALRTRSAPRQLLQVKPERGSSPTGSPLGGAKDSKPSTGSHLLEGLMTQSDQARSMNAAQGGNTDGQALSHRAILAILERIYDTVLDLEQLRRVQPPLLGAAAAAKEHLASGAASEEVQEGLEKQARETQHAVDEWDVKYAELTAKLWTELRVMEPLDRCTPHPFVALISVLKGKRILPRALRHLSPEQTLTLLTLIVATFDTLDTVRDASILDSTDDVVGAPGGVEGKQRRAVVETKTEAFLNAILAPVMGVIGQAPLRMVTGMLGLLMERNDLTQVVRSKPGIAFLTLFLSRAESLKQATPAPDAQDLVAWQQTFDHLFDRLIQQLPNLFPSTRAIANLPFGAAAYLSNHQAPGHLNTIRPDIDRDDEPVWRLLAAVAVCAEANEQETLVTSVRDKVLENVTSAKKARVAPEVAALKIRNVNLLLHSLGLDASQLTVED